MGKPAILCVDDEPLILSSLRRDIDGKAHRLLTAESAQEALEILEKEDVHVLLADCRMPGMSGLQLMAIVRETHPLLVRAMLTGLNDAQTAISAINDGHVYRFIQKPWNGDELRDVVERCLAQAERMRGVKKDPESAEIDRKVMALDGLENAHPGISEVKRGAGGVIEIDPDEE